MPRGHPKSQRGPLASRVPVCFLAVCGVMDHPQRLMPACEGRLVKCHLIKRTVIRHNVGAYWEWDRRVWVWGCGGITGSGGHHGMLDHSRTLRIPRSALPAAVEEFALEHGLLWWLDKEYGER